MRGYIKDQYTHLIIYAVCVIIFVLSFSLYRLPVMGVLYPAVISFVIMAIRFGMDYIRHGKRRKAILACMEDTEGRCIRLQEFNSCVDREYQELIEVLCNDINRQKEAYDAQTSDMIDYYTTWVHQIKTPIASMRLTLQNEDSPASREIAADLFSIEQYVEMALCYLRLDSDSTDYVFRTYVIDDVVKPVIRKFAGQFIAKGLQFDYTPSGLKSVTDSKWLAFVIEQVVSNALKYTYEGSIYIYTENECLCIRDTGIGIDSGDLPRIFEKGYTGFNGRMNQKSSGLGLYLCKRICDNMGHKLKVESETGVGTVVKLGFDIQDRIFE